MAVRFLFARKFDVTRSLALFEQHELTRQREGLTRFDPTSEPLHSELLTGKFTILVSYLWNRFDRWIQNLNTVLINKYFIRIDIFYW